MFIKHLTIPIFHTSLHAPAVALALWMREFGTLCLQAPSLNLILYVPGWYHIPRAFAGYVPVAHGSYVDVFINKYTMVAPVPVFVQNAKYRARRDVML